MSRTEDRARAAMSAIAATVEDAPPLRLRPAPQPERSPARIRDRRWRSWLPPVIAAAVILVLAVSLVIVRNVMHHAAVPPVPASSAAGLGGAPRYYVALKTQGSAGYGIVVGDSVTGQTLATFAPAARTTFTNVSAAADDRTFAVLAVTSSSGSPFAPAKNTTVTGSWYEVHIAPGTGAPVRLSRLPIQPWSWAGGDFSVSAPGQIAAMALSASGRELAVASIPQVPAAEKPQNWQEVRVFSVTTGRLLHDWTEDDPDARLATALVDTLASVPTGNSALTWVDGDSALELATSHEGSNAVTGTVRRLNVAGPAKGSLLTDAGVIWSGTLSRNDTGSCLAISAWPPQISADGIVITCMTIDMPYDTPGHIDFGTVPLAPGTTAATKPKVAYQAKIPPEKQTGGVNAGIVWGSPSLGTLIVEWVPGGNLSPPKRVHFGVISQGRFIPLKVPVSLAASTATALTF